MKTMPIALALLCAACAGTDQLAKEEVYQPPVYRTGSNLPVQAGTRGVSPESTSVDGEAFRQALPPAMVRKPPGG